MELGGPIVVRRLVDLVRDDRDRDLGAPKEISDLRVALPQSGACVDYEHGGFRVGDRLADLVLDSSRHRVRSLEVHPTGVDQAKGDAVPLAVDRLAVAGDAGLP